MFMADVREILTWEKYGAAVRDLAQEVADDGYRPEMILAIARGGLFISASLGYALSVKNIYVMNVEYYTGVDERLDVPAMLPPYIDLVDMEAYALKKVCEHHSVAFSAYKFISDDANAEAGDDWKNAVKNGTHLFEKILIKNYGLSELLG